MADFSKDIVQGKVKVKNINDFERLVKLDMLLMGEATERVERGGTQELSQDAKDRLDEIAQLMKVLRSSADCTMGIRFFPMENTEPFVRIAQRKRKKVNKSNFLRFM